MRPGEIYKCNKELNIYFQIHWRLPYSSGSEGLLPKNTLVSLKGISKNNGNIYFALYPVRGRKIENKLIPKKERKNQKYDGYTIIVEELIFKKNFQPYTDSLNYLFKFPLYRWLNYKGWI